MTNPHATPALASDGDRYRFLVDAITDHAIFMLDIEGRVASWNSGARRLKGYETDEILGSHFSRFYPADDRAAGLPAAALRTAARDGRFHAEGWRLRKDGSRFWASVVIEPIRAADGTVMGFAKVTRDLTERRHAEAELRRSEEQFRLLVQGVTDYAIFMLDTGGYVTSWNAGAARIKGYRSEEIVGRHFSTFYVPEDRDAGLPAEALRTALRDGRFEAEGRRQRKDGGRFWASVVIDPVRDESGRLIGFAKVTRDITERREAQQALATAREALFQAQKMEAVGQLTGGVAHDFNNLLAAILGGLELLTRRLPEDPKAHMLVDTMMHAAHRGAALTRRMLTFARRQPLAVHPVDIAALVAGMADLLGHTLGPAITLRTEFPPNLPPVATDPHHLETALVNLALNARDAMASGGTITIAARRNGGSDGGAPAGGAFVCLSIADDGIGMDEATLARATEPFFTTKGVGKGTGLGLSMVHGLAAQSGGRLALRSRPGEGTVVELWLPATTAAADSPVSGRDEADLPPGDRSLTILLVDDDDLVLASTRAMLEELGHRVTAVGSGAAALIEIAGTGRIDLLVTDQLMPGMTGTALARRSRFLRPHLPILLVSGYADLAAEDAALPQLPKPFTAAQLAAALIAAIGPASPAVAAYPPRTLTAGATAPAPDADPAEAETPVSSA